MPQPLIRARSASVKNVAISARSSFACESQWPTFVPNAIGGGCNWTGPCADAITERTTKKTGGKSDARIQILVRYADPAIDVRTGVVFAGTRPDVSRFLLCHRRRAAQKPMRVTRV